MRSLSLPSKLHSDSRSGRHVRSRWGRLFTRYPAAYGFEVETGVLGGFHRAAHGFANEGWDFDATLLYVDHYGSACGKGWGQRRGVCDARPLRGRWIGLICDTRHWFALPHRRLHYTSVTASSRGRGRPRHICRAHCF